MANSNEEISKNTTVGGRTDSNISNDSNHLGGIPAEDFATKTYVQNYHDTKEGTQKQYIDEQNTLKLSEAKSYTDTVVSNQDFSAFAKQTDLQALNTNLTNKINNDITSSNNLTDNKIGAVVTDVNTFNNQTTQQINSINSNINSLNGSMNVANSNINYLNLQLAQEVRNRQIGDNALSEDISLLQENVTNAQGNISTLQSNMTTAQGKVSNLESNVSSLQRNVSNIEEDVSSLEETTQELFTSVSNGKQAIATAITDKGISTASDSSFSTMANNISQIEAGADTQDATATQNDILLGKTAYAKGVKIYGTHVDLDTSDATATSDDILLGKTAYVNGNKVYGTYVADDQKQYPTYGTDTSNATVNSPDDLAYGKTAYSNGQLIIGSGNLNSNVEEIYKPINTEYEFIENNLGTNDPPDGQPKTVYRKRICVSHNADYVVILGASVSSPTKADYYVESFPLGENGICYTASSGLTTENITYKKYRYTRDELGITDEEEIVDITLGAPGLDGNNSQCYLMILTSTGLRFYTYHLNDNGIIGKEYNSQGNSIYNVFFSKNLILSSTSLIYASATLSNVFYAFYDSMIQMFKIQSGVKDGKIVQELITDSKIYSGTATAWSNPYFTKDGKYIVYSSRAYYDVRYGPSIQKLDSTGSIIATTSLSNFCSLITLFDSNICISFSSETKNGLKVAKIDIMELIISNNSISKTTTKTIFSDDLGNYYVRGGAIVTPDNSKIFVIIYNPRTDNHDYRYSYKLAMFDVNEILNAESGETIGTVIFPFNSPVYSMGTDFKLAVNSNGSRIKMYNGVSGAQQFMVGNYYIGATDVIIGVKYKGMYFNRIQDQVFTACQPDVKKGKTFIGWQGVPETGTMETDESN